MPVVEFNVNEREHREMLALRGTRPWRAFILEALDIHETKRRLGRPRTPSAVADVKPKEKEK